MLDHPAPSPLTKAHADHLRFLLLLLLLLLALLVSACAASPLFPGFYGYDSAIFSLLGKGITEGKRLYLDLFDHKGPLIFWIDALGHLIGGNSGIFLLECAALLVSAGFLYTAARLLRPDGLSGLQFSLLFLAGYTMFFRTLQLGNSTEEYSVPFLACSLVLFIRYILQADTHPAHPPLYALIHGIGLGCIAFLRLNNAVPIAAGVLFIGVYLLRRREFHSFLLNLLFGLLGLLLVFVPVLLWFSAHDSLAEMLYATFLHNVTIFANTAHTSLIEDPTRFIKQFFPMAVCLVLWISYRRRVERRPLLDGLLLCLLILSTGALLLANRFDHYFLVFFPVYFLFLFAYARFDLRSLACLALIASTVLNLLVSVLYVRTAVQTVWLSDQAQTQETVLVRDFSRIPEDEQTSVIGYNISPAYYLQGDVLPCYKYYTLQDTWAITNPQILTDFMDYVSRERPLWVLTEPGQDQPELTSILSENYELMFSDEYLLFYRLLEENAQMLPAA